jgi:HEAT repeat protein
MKALRTLEAGSRLHRSDGGAVAVTTFVRALGHATPAIRREAALALAVLDPVPAEAALLSHLDDVDDDVRYFVADALGGVPTPHVLAALDARLKVEKSPTVQYALKTASDRVKRVMKP